MGFPVIDVGTTAPGASAALRFDPFKSVSNGCFIVPDISMCVQGTSVRVSGPFDA